MRYCLKNIVESCWLWYTIPAADPSARREVESMDAIASFALSVLAGVVSYYICKWLDHRKDKKKQDRQ